MIRFRVRQTLGHSGTNPAGSSGTSGRFACQSADVSGPSAVQSGTAAPVSSPPLIVPSRRGPDAESSSHRVGEPYGGRLRLTQGVHESSVADGCVTRLTPYKAESLERVFTACWRPPAKPVRRRAATLCVMLPEVMHRVLRCFRSSAAGRCRGGTEAHRSAAGCSEYGNLDEHVRPGPCTFMPRRSTDR